MEAFTAQPNMTAQAKVLETKVAETQKTKAAIVSAEQELAEAKTKLARLRLELVGVNGILRGIEAFERGHYREYGLMDPYMVLAAVGVPQELIDVARQNAIESGSSEPITELLSTRLGMKRGLSPAEENEVRKRSAPSSAVPIESPMDVDRKSKETMRRCCHET